MDKYDSSWPEEFSDQFPDEFDKEIDNEFRNEFNNEFKDEYDYGDEDIPPIDNDNKAAISEEYPDDRERRDGPGGEDAE